MASSLPRPTSFMGLVVALLFSATLPTAGASGFIDSVRRSLVSCRMSANCGITCAPPSEKCDGPGYDGSSVPSQPAQPSQPASPPTHCYGNLPFGLENCICDGAQVGEAAGIAACSRVATQCEHFVPFSNLEAVSRICDSLALDACTSSARIVLEQNPTCLKHFDKGGSSCTGSEAKKTFDDAVKEFCEPLCPDCPRRKESEYPGEKPQVPQVPPSRPTGSSGPKCTDSLEFQLETCVCDGEITGEKVARAACEKVKYDCIPDSVLAAFSVSTNVGRGHSNLQRTGKGCLPGQGGAGHGRRVLGNGLCYWWTEVLTWSSTAEVP